MAKIVTDLRATVRDIVLAFVAAAGGVIIAAEVLPKTSAELKVLASAALYAGLRAAVAYIASLLDR